MSSASRGSPPLAQPVQTRRDHTRRLNLFVLVVLVGALALGTGFRLHTQRAVANVQNDEAWSYTAAAGRLRPFTDAMNGDMAGRWVPAAEWQRFWQSDDLADVANIAPDLAAFDVHPPLYFGLLHGWLMVVGEGVWAGRALNVVFAAFTVLGIFGLARALGFERLEGSLVALTWAVSPAVISISSMVRHYDLVALTAVLLVWSLVHATSPGNGRPWRAALWVALATAAALLTHYQEVLLVAGGALFSLAGLILPMSADGRRRPWWPPLAGLATGSLAAALASPGWSQAFGRERSRLTGFDAEVFADKLGAIGDTLGHFAGVPLLMAAPAVCVVVLLLVPRTRQSLLHGMRAARRGWWTVVFFLAVTLGGILLQNLLFLSQPPLLTTRYLAMAWPFVAFLPLLFFTILPRWCLALTAAFCLLVLVPASILSPIPYGLGDALPLQRLADADAVLIDNVGAGVFPRFLWWVPADTPVFAGTQKQFLADAGSWREAETGSRTYYISMLRRGGMGWRRDRILKVLRAANEVTLVGSNGKVDIYTVTPRPPE